MNAYEQKQEERRQRYLDLAAKKHSEAANLKNQAEKMAGIIPFGQPILVGHHSERADRNYRNKIINKFEKSFELSNTAKYYEEKATSVGKGGISSDDPDAIEKLKEKLVTLEKTQEVMKAANKALRKNDDETLRKLGFSDSRIAKLKQPDFCGRIGFPDYALTNNNANIRRIRERIKHLEKLADKQPIEVHRKGYTYKEEDNRCQFVFDDKPCEEIRNILKYHAFKWSPSRGAWVRQLTGNGKFAAKQVIEKLEKVM